MASHLLIEPNEAGLDEAAELLRSGQLLAFPTETVYGLGANALNENAVLDIFRAKGRPLTDPLIVHIAHVEDAHRLIDVSPDVEAVFTVLGRQFWPGPLTIITKASNLIPLSVTANTGSVGIRCPRHSLARKLIELAGVPVAAPSANRFGHVSPTRAQHVLDDLSEKGVKVLNGESQLLAVESSCEFGIESTVIKLNAPTNEIWLYRQGAVTQAQLEACLKTNSINWTVKVVKRTVNMHEQTAPTSSSGQVGEEAPGQAITHYAPDVKCYMIQSIINSENEFPQDCDFVPLDNILRIQSRLMKSGAVMIDFGAQYSKYKDMFLAYRDLSAKADSCEAAQSLFDVLRWTEGIEGAKVVLVAHIDASVCSLQDRTGSSQSMDLSLGLADRIYRAASGVAVTVETSFEQEQQT